VTAADERSPRLQVRTVGHEMAVSDLRLLRGDLHAFKMGSPEDHICDLDTKYACRPHCECDRPQHAFGAKVRLLASHRPIEQVPSSSAGPSPAIGIGRVST
jgi:hypothetical protein